MTDHKEEIRAALLRIEKAGVKSDRLAMLAWIGAVGPETILAASLKEIREVTRAF